MAEHFRVARGTVDQAVAGRVASVLRDGGVCVLPTDTLYGLHARADSDAALLRLVALKGRDPSRPLVVLLPSGGCTSFRLPPFPPLAEALATRFWPGPLTLVVPAPSGFSPLSVGPGGTVAVRRPSDAMLQLVVDLVGAPVASTSANLAGGAPLRDPEAILLAFPRGVDAVLDVGTLPESLPSTIVDCTGPSPRILREGAVPACQISGFLSEAAFQ